MSVVYDADIAFQEAARHAVEGRDLGSAQRSLKPITDAYAADARQPYSMQNQWDWWSDAERQGRLLDREIDHSHHLLFDLAMHRCAWIERRAARLLFDLPVCLGAIVLDYWAWDDGGVGWTPPPPQSLPGGGSCDDC